MLTKLCRNFNSFVSVANLMRNNFWSDAASLVNQLITINMNNLKVKHILAFYKGKFNFLYKHFEIAKRAFASIPSWSEFYQKAVMMQVHIQEFKDLSTKRKILGEDNNNLGHLSKKEKAGKKCSKKSQQ